MKPKWFISWKWNSVESSIVSHLHNINQLNGFKAPIDIKCRRIFIIHAFKIELPFAFEISIWKMVQKITSACCILQKINHFSHLLYNALRPGNVWIWITIRCNHGQKLSIDADLLIRKQVAVWVYLQLTHMYRISSMCKLFDRLQIVESNFILQWVIQWRQYKYTSRWPQNSNIVHQNKLPIAVSIHVNEVNFATDSKHKEQTRENVRESLDNV